MTHIKTRFSWSFFLLLGSTFLSPLLAEDGITNNVIRIGGVLDLEGRSKGLGQNMKIGIEAAFKDATVKEHRLEYIVLNDSYTPAKTIKSTHELIKKKVFLFAGNVGTPTAKVSLPIIADHKIPAVGFFTGAGLLRPGKGDIINYRASYVQETAAVIKVALKKGLKSNEVCAFVQNDAYGMAGITGILKALKGTKNSETSIAALNKIKALSGDNPPRNNIGPVGVYKRNSYLARSGYLSLKAWEKSQNIKCKLVITVGSYQSIAEFIAYSRYKKEPWVFTAVSFTGADNFKKALQSFEINSGVIITQVVPPLDSNIPLIIEARQKLGKDFGVVSLEGFIVGKLILHGLEKIKGKITRKAFTRALLNSRFSIEQLSFDFLNDNQGSDLVELMFFDQGEWLASNDQNIWTSK
ncbi:MAG TPA: branched-chain amino acid ABC transporter substrate-binding protein [Leucothrix mucor]|nr:branched-chain amino acid ABC transporter substrate-binding protein [Leucothrix mucor]